MPSPSTEDDVVADGIRQRFNSICEATPATAVTRFALGKEPPPLMVRCGRSSNVPDGLIVLLASQP